MGYRRWPGPGPFGRSELELYIISNSVRYQAGICICCVKSYLSIAINNYPLVRQYVDCFKSYTKLLVFYSVQGKLEAGRAIADYLSREKRALSPPLRLTFLPSSVGLYIRYPFVPLVHYDDLEYYVALSTFVSLLLLHD